MRVCGLIYVTSNNARHSGEAKKSEKAFMAKIYSTHSHGPRRAHKMSGKRKIITE
jgi:hypothetical protein